MEAFGERQLAVFDPLLGRKPPDPPMNLFDGSEAEDGDVEVARDALQLAQAEAMGGSHDGEALVVEPMALEGLASGDLQLRLVAGPETLPAASAMAQDSPWPRELTASKSALRDAPPTARAQARPRAEVLEARRRHGCAEGRSLKHFHHLCHLEWLEWFR